METKELKTFLLENEDNYAIVNRLTKSLEISEQTSEEFVQIGPKILKLIDKINSILPYSELFIGELNFLDEFLKKCLNTSVSFEVLDFSDFSTMYSIINTVDRRLEEISSQSKAKGPKFEDIIKQIQKDMKSSTPLPPTNSIAKYDELDIVISDFFEKEEFSSSSLQDLINSFIKIESNTLLDKKHELLGIAFLALRGVNSAENDGEMVKILNTFCDSLKKTYDSGVILNYINKVLS